MRSPGSLRTSLRTFFARIFDWLSAAAPWPFHWTVVVFRLTSAQEARRG
jgi:hypothetical protein